jgi:hypothetical protein
MVDVHRLLAQHATTYAWCWVDPEEPFRVVDVTIEGRQPASAGDPSPIQWAIVLDHSMVLNRAGDWEYEPQPSSRTEEFLARTRWPSPAEALAFVEATLPGWVSEGVMPVVADFLTQQAARRSR